NGHLLPRQPFDPRTRRPELLGQRIGSQPQRLHVFFAEDFARVDRRIDAKTHRPSPSMIADDFNILCPCGSPTETYSPLAIDADRMLSLSIAAQELQFIARRRLEIVG